MSGVVEILQGLFPGKSFVFVVRSDDTLTVAGVTKDDTDTRQLLSDALQVELTDAASCVTGCYDTPS